MKFVQSEQTDKPAVSYPADRSPELPAPSSLSIVTEGSSLPDFYSFDNGKYLSKMALYYLKIIMLFFLMSKF